MQAQRKVPHAEAKEEPGLRSGEPMTIQVVALAVIRSTSGWYTPGQHGPVLFSGELRMTFRVQRYAVLSESRMRGCDLARSRNRVGANPIQVTVSHGPGIESCSQRGNSLIDA